MAKRVGNYEFGDVLGQGAYGKVRECTHTENGQGFAVKVVSRKMLKEQGGKADEMLRRWSSRPREICIMKFLCHSNVLRLTEVLQSPKYIYIVLELVKGSDLLDYIMEADRLGEGEARHFFHQLVLGVGYCHHHGAADPCHHP
eukprot:gene6810-6501_t